jgi:hypothetical protein
MLVLNNGVGPVAQFSESSGKNSIVTGAPSQSNVNESSEHGRKSSFSAGVRRNRADRRSVSMAAPG